MKKKTLSLILAAAMVFTLSAVTAMADEADYEGLDSVELIGADSTSKGSPVSASANWLPPGWMKSPAEN